MSVKRDKLKHATRTVIISTKPIMNFLFKNFTCGIPYMAHPWKILFMKIADKTLYRNRLFTDRHGAARKYAKHETFK